jgi:L-Ala-D/L-Glu epimerase
MLQPFSRHQHKTNQVQWYTPARRMIKRARELNLKVMVGCMNESSVGTAAIAQLAPLLDMVDMDGPMLLAQDIARGVSFNNGQIIYNNKPGLGIEMLEW